MATTALGIVSRVKRMAGSGAREGWGRGVGVAKTGLDRAVPGQVLAGSDGVALDAVVLGVGGQVAMTAPNRNERNGPPLSVTIVSTGTTFPSSPRPTRSRGGRPAGQLGGLGEG